VTVFSPLSSNTPFKANVINTLLVHSNVLRGNVCAKKSSHPTFKETVFTYNYFYFDTGKTEMYVFI